MKLISSALLPNKFGLFIFILCLFCVAGAPVLASFYSSDVFYTFVIGFLFNSIALSLNIVAIFKQIKTQKSLTLGLLCIFILMVTSHFIMCINLKRFTVAAISILISFGFSTLLIFLFKACFDDEAEETNLIFSKKMIASAVIAAVFLIFLSLVMLYTPVNDFFSNDENQKTATRISTLFLLLCGTWGLFFTIVIISHSIKKPRAQKLWISFAAIVSSAGAISCAVSLIKSKFFGWAMGSYAVTMIALTINAINSLKGQFEISGEHLKELEQKIQQKENEIKRKIEEFELLREKNIETQEDSRLKSELLANMSHELRTPMNSIIGFTSRVINKTGDILPEQQLNNLKTVMRNAYHLLSLINTILDVSKLEAGKMDVFTEELNLEEVINEVAEMGQSLLQGKEIELKTKVEGMLTIKSDRTKIKQMLVNLLGNAIKFTETGYIEITAKKIEASDNDNKDKILNGGAELKIIDTGVGIKKMDLKYIFDDYKQVDGSLTRKTGGTGLGLALVKRFSVLLGGNVSVESEYERGTTVTIQLPLDMTEVVKKEAEAETINEKPRAWNVLAQGLSETVEEECRLYLQERGVQLINGGSVDSAFSLAQEQYPRLILLDILASENQAFEVIKKCKTNYYTKNIQISAIGIVDAKNAYFLNLVGFEQKPVNKTFVSNVLNAITQEVPTASNIILIDNDEAGITLMHELILAQTQYSLRIARNAQDAITLIAKKKPVILNLTMPNLAAYKIMAEIGANKRWATVPIMLIGSKMLEQGMAEFNNNKISMYPIKSELKAVDVYELVLKRIKGFV